MIKYIGFAAVAMTAAFSTPALADQWTSVVFHGHSIRIGGPNTTVTTVDGQVALVDSDVGGTLGISDGDLLMGEYLVAGNVYVVVEESREGIACDSKFQAIEIAADGTHHTRQFGDCGLPDAKTTATSLILNFALETDTLSATGITTVKHKFQQVNGI